MNTGGPVGRLIDNRFELVERLGGGGMGLVWRARDIALRRDVALKEVRPADPWLAEHDPQAARMLRARVLREARALARVDHPNVVTIHHIVDSGDDTYPWIVMELVTGGSLQDRLDRGPMEPADAARLGREVLSALRAAHAAGILHRDVKPANVLLRPDGRPVLTDFGIAAIRESTSLTATGSLIGSPDYMAPERVSGKDSGPASDLWSLGMMLYVAVEGHHPLRRGSTLATLAAVLSEDVPAPRNAGLLTGALVALLVRAPEARPDGEALDRMLAQAGAGDAPQPSGADPVQITETSYHLAPPASRPPHAAGKRIPQDAIPTDARPGGPGPVNPYAAPESEKESQPPVRQLRAVAIAVSLLGAALAGVMLWTLLPGSHSADPSSDSASSKRSQSAASSPATRATNTNTKMTNLLTPSGIRTAIAKLKPVMGGTKVTQFVVYPEFVTAGAPVKGSKTRYDQFSYQVGGDVATRNSAGGTVISGTVPVDLNTFNWDALPKLLRRAENELGISKPTSRYLIVDPASTLLNTDPGLLVYVGDDYGTAHLAADVKGNVVAKYPRED